MRRKFKRLTAFLLSAAMVFPFFGEYPSGTFDFDWGFDWSVSAEETTPNFSDAKVLTAVDGALCIDGVAITEKTIPAGDYKLESDITTDIYVYTEGSINIDLNSHTWDMSGKYLSLNGNVTFSLYDTSVNKTGKITTSYNNTIYLSGSGSTFNLYSGTVENTADDVNACGVSSDWGSSNLYGGTIKSNAYAIFYYLSQDITINIDNTSLVCGDGYAQIYTSLIQYWKPCAVIDVSDYTGETLTVDAEIYEAAVIKFFTGIKSAQDAENYKINVSFDDDNDFFEEKQEYEEDGGNKYVYVSVPSFTTQPTEKNGYTVAFNHPDATLQWCEVTVYDSATYSEEDGEHDKSYEVNAGDTLIVSLSECLDNFYVEFDCIYNEESLYMSLDSSSKTASVTFDSEGTVDVHSYISPFGAGVYKIEHVRYTELEGENDVQLSKPECETTYVCKATVGERIYYSDEVTIEQEHSYTCTATSDNIITKKCDTCGKSGTLTINAEGGVYYGTTAYGATVEKTGIFENEEVIVNYYQGDTSIGTKAPVDAGTYTAKITYEGVTASVIYMISTTPTAEMFNYSAPANLTYDGTAKSADVVVKDGITGVGEITVKYYQNGTEVTPINAGEYTVKIDVAAGDIYAAAADIEVGTFEITKANTVITWNDQTLASTGEEAELTAPTLTFIGNDNPEVELTYSYKAQGDAEYTNGLPTACGIYDVKVNVSATDNYNAVEDTMTLTITCTDADNNGICDHCDYLDEPELDGEYYQIANAGNLMWFVKQVNEGQTAINAKLTADIDMKDIDWTTMSSFAGTFDGNGHTILYLCADESGGDDDIADGSRCGLFQTLSEGGTVTNLTISGAQLWSAHSAGAIAAVNNGTISKCIVKDSSIQLGASHGLAAIAGTNTGTVKDCGVVNCSMTRRWGATNSGDYAIGAVVEDNSGTVSNCFSYGCGFSQSPNIYAIVESGNVPVNCYYYTDATVSDTVANAKTADQFASGEVAYLLNGSSSENVTWYQKLLIDTYPVLDSEHGIVYSVFKCDGTTPAGYSNVNKNEPHIDENGDEYCDDCGVIYNGIGAHLAGYSVSLNGSIGVNFHMDLTQDVLDDNEAYMLFTLPNGTTQKVMVSDAKAKESTVIEGKTYYIFTCNVAAKEMTDTIQAQLITSDGSKTQVYEYSVREYADRILSGSYDAETKELVKAMLHYGAYSQEWFDYNTTNLANAGLDTLDLSDADDWDEFNPIISNNDKVGSFNSAYLTLESDTAINLKFKLADGVSFEDLRFVVQDPMGNVVPATIDTTENVCLITLTGIKASDLDTTYDFSVTDKEGNESVISYSAMSYACAVAKSEMDQKLKNVTAALRIFNLRANEKFEY